MRRLHTILILIGFRLRANAPERQKSDFLSVSVTKCGRNYTERYKARCDAGRGPYGFPDIGRGTSVASPAAKHPSLRSWRLQMKARFSVMVLVGVCLGIPGLADEFVGPFPSWANVKTMYNAKGDGITDDTAALQAALNAVGTAGKSDVVYLPAGTYKITATLKQTQKQYVSVVGQDPATTKILWTGPAGGWMLWANGVSYSRWARITWDGANTAGIGVAPQMDHVNNGYAATALEHSDEVFQDMKRGIVGGDPGSNYGWNDAEVSIIRSKFIRNSEAGVSVESWNALNYFIWDSEFTDNVRGVTNTFHAGNFHVYRSVFRNSSVADIHIGNMLYFSFVGTPRSARTDSCWRRTSGKTRRPSPCRTTRSSTRFRETRYPTAMWGPCFSLTT